MLKLPWQSESLTKLVYAQIWEERLSWIFSPYFSGLVYPWVVCKFSVIIVLQGSPQFVILEFPEEVCVKEIQIQFQGGFVGKECCLEGGTLSSSLTPFFEFYPDDFNTLQVSFSNFTYRLAHGEQIEQLS